MLGTDSGTLGIAYRTRSSIAASASQLDAPDFALRGGPLTKGTQPASGSESFAAAQLAALHLPSATAQQDGGSDQPSCLVSSALNAQTSPRLTLSQRGELELAKARAERAAAGRSRYPQSGNGGGSAKRSRGHSAGDASVPASDEDDGGDHSDGELDLSRLTPEEQERLLSSKSTDKDARRLKRLLRNRVSAQQARERKKQYVTSLEDQIRDQQAHMGVLEQRVADLEVQNTALRNIIRTMRGFADAPPAPPDAHAGGAGGVGSPRGAAPAGGSPRAALQRRQQQQQQRADAAAAVTHDVPDPDGDDAMAQLDSDYEADEQAPGLQGQGYAHRQRHPPPARNSCAQLLRPNAANGAPHPAGAAPGPTGRCSGDGSLLIGSGLPAHLQALRGGAALESDAQLLMRPGLRPGPLLHAGGEDSELGDAGVVPLGFPDPDFMPDMR